MNAARALSAVRHADRLPEILRAAKLTAAWPQFTAAYMGLRDRYPFELEIRSGDRFELASIDDVATAWIIFCRREYRVSPAFETIVDAGANIGLFSIFAARRAPRSRIVALEPFPSAFALLERHLEVNDLTQRIAARPWALGPRNGSGRMDGAPGLPSQKRALLSPELPEQARATDAHVPMLTLGSLFEREGLTQVDLLKIDVEGAEYGIFASTPPEVLRKIGNIAMEYHPSGSRDEVFGRILGASFELVEEVSFSPGNGVAHFVRR